MGAIPQDDKFDREKFSRRTQQMFTSKSTCVHPLRSLLGMEPSPYQYRVSDLSEILPADLWAKCQKSLLRYPVVNHPDYEPSQQRLSARIRYEMCLEARDRGVDDPRLIQAIQLEGDAVVHFSKLANHFRRKGWIE